MVRSVSTRIQEGASMKLFLDLCSGLGGASEAFAQSPHWVVIRIENNPELDIIPHTRILDINQFEEWLKDIPFEAFEEVVIWSSPPCREFSDGYASPKSIAAREGELGEYEPNMEIFDSTRAIISLVEPDWWIIENVKGASPYFIEEIGEHRQRIGPFLLWGVFPFIDVGPYFKHEKRNHDVHSSNPLRANIKAKIPIEVSQALMDSLDSVIRLDRY
jgi:site-specific DNA-cytosine methylase